MPHIIRKVHIKTPQLTAEEMNDRKHNGITYPLTQTEGYYCSRELAEEQCNNLVDNYTSHFGLRFTYEIVDN